MSSSSLTSNKLKIFISSTMADVLGIREIVAEVLRNKGLHASFYEVDEEAKSEDAIETSLREVESADIYIGLLWDKYSEVTAQEYRYARALGKPSFIYIRDWNHQREKSLEHFLQTEVYRDTVCHYFDNTIKLSEQIATDIMGWLVQRHREMTAEIREFRKYEELVHLQSEVNRLQAIASEHLPQGTASDSLAYKLRSWFKTLNYSFENHHMRSDNYFEWIISVPARRGYDRILVYGIAKEATVSDVNALREAVNKHKTKEGWLVASHRVSQAARDIINKWENSDLFCYTFDELLDEHADFSGYFDWLEAEIKRQAIDRRYIPLACTKEEFDPITKQKIGESLYDAQNGWIDGYIDLWLQDPTARHISILGSFGTGKTWFALHYAWKALQNYREAKERGIERPRLPLFITLHDYAKAVSIESLFSEFFFRKHEIPLPGYSAFEQLNRMGKFLLIFDGFDEMADKVDRQKMINNFWELARVVVPGTKVILTCRTEHFPEAREGRALLNAELLAATTNLQAEPPQFEVLELSPFSEAQTRQVLSFRTEPATVEWVMGNPELLDLTRRPVMTEMILNALPDIGAGKPVDLSRVYLYAIRHIMEQDIKAERTFTSLADKLYFLCEVSWEMLSTGQLSLNYRLFPERLHYLFGSTLQERKDLDHWHYDMMGQSLLIRNADGDYTPAHRTLIEFFAAYKCAAELGILASDFTELARAQSYLDVASSPRDYTWSFYFQRNVDRDGRVKLIPPLQTFITERMDNLVATVGKVQMTEAVLALIQNMLIPDREKVKTVLQTIIHGVQGGTQQEVGSLGDNVSRLLITSAQQIDGDVDLQLRAEEVKHRKEMNDYDVFFCCNDDEEDKREVEKICDELEKRGLVTWFEGRDMQPGRLRFNDMAKQIQQVKTAAICFGNKSDHPRWRESQMEALLHQFIERGCTIILVLLKHAPHEKPESPFLDGKWVDFHNWKPDPLEQLIWGVAGKMP